MKTMNEGHFRKMYEALRIIAKDYQTPAQLKKDSEKSFGLDYEEALEMSYENIQLIAKSGIKGVANPYLNEPNP